MPELIGAVLLACYAILSVKFIVDEDKEIKQQQQEEEEFEKERIARRVQVIYRDKLTARMVLMHKWKRVGRLGYYKEV